MDTIALLELLGHEITDPEEEAFLLFTQSIPSQNLGFVDSKATELELTVGGQDLTIIQSPTILSSNRSGGTTGAVVWKITPLIANWLAPPTNFLFSSQILTSSSTILELGCGISGIIALAVAPKVHSYVLTDQSYVQKLVTLNITQNKSTSSKLPARKSKNKDSKAAKSNITFQPLDWETDEVTPALTGSESERSFDVVIACDCIYNDALIEPLVQTCVDACKLRVVDGGRETVCLVAQQLRSPEVFEEWLKTFQRSFRVWRVPDEKLGDGLKEDSGFVVHVGILK